jgi:hypothetical protein
VFRRLLSKAQKSRNIWHIPYFCNAAEQDGWALKMGSYFCASHKATFATWNHRIAPLLDVTRQACFLEKNANGTATRRIVSFCNANRQPLTANGTV